MRSVSVLGLAAVLTGLGLSGAAAQPIVFDEIRGGLYAHSIDEGSFDASRIEDANVELLFSIPSLDEVTLLGQLRPHIGATINLGGLESMLYAGMSWTVPLGDTPIFVEAAFGGAVHNGELEGAEYPMRDLGCRVLFHESLSLGVNITEQASIMATVEHASHGSICEGDNRGLTNLGVRVGWKF
ncbi:acyloxyacyl hydrolase [Devosia geojensis]|uniref:acyloxyacyl hydrolase n=1 Tax=Devosia geojensis TaxID=443610 RepID=UPI0006983EA1|nr:acyloxyacyl hydrolase [Devosia geojensis]